MFDGFGVLDEVLFVSCAAMAPTVNVVANATIKKRLSNPDGLDDMRVTSENDETVENLLQVLTPESTENLKLV